MCGDSSQDLVRVTGRLGRRTGPHRRAGGTRCVYEVQEAKELSTGPQRRHVWEHAEVSGLFEADEASAGAIIAKYVQQRVEVDGEHWRKPDGAWCVREAVLEYVRLENARACSARERESVPRARRGLSHHGRWELSFLL